MLLRRAASSGARRLIDAAGLAATSGCRLGDCTAHATAAAATEGAPASGASSPRQHQQQQPQQAARMERKPLAPPGYSRTFYKRQLPSPPAIEFASDRGTWVLLPQRPGRWLFWGSWSS